MLGKIFGILCLISLIYGTVVGNGEALGNAVLDGAAGAVELTLSLCGMMCLWCGIMRVLQEAGLIDRLAKGFAADFAAGLPPCGKNGRRHGGDFGQSQRESAGDWQRGYPAGAAGDGGNGSR